LANRFFSVKLGGTLDSDVTEAAATTAADYLEVRIDEVQTTDLDKIVQGLNYILKRIQEDKRYA
jgi:hypothetical protein